MHKITFLANDPAWRDKLSAWTSGLVQMARPGEAITIRANFGDEKPGPLDPGLDLTGKIKDIGWRSFGLEPIAHYYKTRGDSGLVVSKCGTLHAKHDIHEIPKDRLSKFVICKICSGGLDELLAPGTAPGVVK